jgi:hypothetical protein
MARAGPLSWHANVLNLEFLGVPSTGSGQALAVQLLFLVLSASWRFNM